MAILKSILLFGAFLTAVIASPLEGGAKKLQVRDLLANNPGLDAFIEDIASRRKMKRDHVIDGIQVDYVVADRVTKPKLLAKRDVVGGESANNDVTQEMLMTANTMCAQRHGGGKRALQGGCVGNNRQVTCGDPGARGWGGYADGACQQPKPVCKEFRANNYKGQVQKFPICQEKELTDDSSASTSAGVLYTGIHNFPLSPGSRRQFDLWAQTDQGLHFDWDYVGKWQGGDRYKLAENNVNEFTALNAPTGGTLSFTHLGNIAAAYIYWSPY